MNIGKIQKGEPGSQGEKGEPGTPGIDGKLLIWCIFNFICFQLPIIHYLFIIGYPGEKGSIGPIVSILSINKGSFNHNLKYLKF